jgi:hypothetical protein
VRHSYRPAFLGKKIFTHLCNDYYLFLAKNNRPRILVDDLVDPVASERQMAF